MCWNPYIYSHEIEILQITLSSFNFTVNMNEALYPVGEAASTITDSIKFRYVSLKNRSLGHDITGGNSFHDGKTIPTIIFSHN
jgi:hypothetical protein